MFFTKGWCVFLAFAFSISFVSAIGITVTNISSTSIRVDVSSASNLYAYEVNFDYSGSPGSPTFATFLGSGTTSGSSSRGSIFSVYESKQDGTSTGVSGSGNIFNLTYSGTISLRYLLAFYGDGTTEYVYYNTSSGGSSNSSSSSSSSSSGGGGGSSSSASTRPSINLNDVKITSDPAELSISAVSGHPFTREVTLTNKGKINVTLTISPIGFKDITVARSVTLNVGEEKTIPISFEGTDKGIAAGQLSFSIEGNPVYSLPIVINSRSENFLFDSILTIAQSSKTIRSGQSVQAQINLQQVAKQTGKVDVVASYIVKDFFGATYLEESETFYVLGSKDYEKEFTLPELPPGKYILGLEITYPGAFATTSAQFQVAPPFWSFNTTTLIIVGVGAMVIIFAGVLFWASLRKRALYRRHK